MSASIVIEKAFVSIVTAKESVKSFALTQSLSVAMIGLAVAKTACI